MGVERRQAAVLAADVVGYSRMMGVDELGTLTILNEYRLELIEPLIAAHKGRIVKTTGDGALVEFANALDAVTCAMAYRPRCGSAIPARRKPSPFASVSMSATSLSMTTTSLATASISPRGSRTNVSPAACTCRAAPLSKSEARPILRSMTSARDP